MDDSSPKSKLRRKRKLTPILFILPALTVLLVVIVSPVLYSFGISFFRYRLNVAGLGLEFVGLENYLYIFQDREMIQSVIWTLQFTVLAVILELILGMILALLLNSKVLGKTRGLVRGLFLLPIMFSPVVTSWIWRLMFDTSYGPLNHFLTVIGLEKIPWGANAVSARAMILITDVWLATPFAMLILLAGLQNIPEELLESASIDGASSWQKFRAIVLPLLKFPVLVVVVIRTMDALRIFDMIFVLTSGGPGTATTTVMYYNYRYAFHYYQMGRAAAISFAFMLIIIVVTYIYNRVLRRDVEY